MVNLDDLVPEVYAELQRLAARALRQERPLTRSTPRRWFMRPIFDSRRLQTSHTFHEASCSA